MAKSKRSKAKAAAWKAFSLYIRTRDVIERGDGHTAPCITCGAMIPAKGNDAGHYVPGRSDSVLFDEHNCHLQCVGCNRFKQGAFIEYEEALLEMYGADEVQRLKELKHIIIKYTEQNFRDIQAKYKEKLKNLLGEI